MIFRSNKEINLEEIMKLMFSSDDEGDENKDEDCKSQDTDEKVKQIVTKILSKTQVNSTLTESDYMGLKL